MNLIDEITRQLRQKGELTAEDVQNRLRTYRGLELTHDAVTAALKSMGKQRLVRATPISTGQGHVSIWRMR